MKSQGKSGVVRESSIIFSKSGENQGKNYFVHISFSLTFSMAACKVVVPFVSVNVTFITLHSGIASICTLTMYWASLSLPIFINM